jgi:hypothetical protein
MKTTDLYDDECIDGLGVLWEGDDTVWDRVWNTSSEDFFFVKYDLIFFFKFEHVSMNPCWSQTKSWRITSRDG